MNSLHPTIITLPWRHDAAEFWFSALSHKPWAMLLHSGYADHPYSRFDIIVADPISYFETYGTNTKISKKKDIFSNKDPLSLLESTLLTTEFHACSHPDFPFQGGAVGLFGYDLVRRFENLPAQAENDIALPDMAVGFYDWALIIDHYKKKVSLLSYTNPNTRLEWLRDQNPATNSPLCLTSNWRSNMTFKQYSEKFSQIQDYLYNGDCYQVNFSQRFQANYIGDEWQAFCRLNANSRAPFSAFLRLEHGAILSLSPEQFIRLTNNNIQTRPIKGTLPRLLNLQDDYQQKLKLATSLKDKAENLMIVDLMRNDIGRIAEPGSILVPELFIVEAFPTVYHLVSTITARLLPSYNACSLLRATFPGGSVTGAPKIRAMEIIDELEPHRRNAWCGTIGYLSLCGTMDTSINIRTLIACNNKLYCSAGGGIIVDSQVKIEYQETLDKINHILRLLKN